VVFLLGYPRRVGAALGVYPDPVGEAGRSWVLLALVGAQESRAPTRDGRTQEPTCQGFMLRSSPGRVGNAVSLHWITIGDAHVIPRIREKEMGRVWSDANPLPESG